jgi:hypothetical protein
MPRLLSGRTALAAITLSHATAAGLFMGGAPRAQHRQLHHYQSDASLERRQASDLDRSRSLDLAVGQHARW